MYGERSYTAKETIKAIFCWHEPTWQGQSRGFLECKKCNHEWGSYFSLRSLWWLITGRYPKE